GLDAARHLAAEDRLGAVDAPFDGVLRVVPAADVPPGPVRVVPHAEHHQEALRAARLAGLHGEGVVGPGRIAGDRADVFERRRLAVDAARRLPRPPERTPARGAVLELRGQQFAAAVCDAGVAELRLRAPGAEADRAARGRML